MDENDFLTKNKSKRLKAKMMTVKQQHKIEIQNYVSVMQKFKLISLRSKSIF